MSADEPVPLLGITAQDAGLDRQLRDTLRTLRDSTTPELRDLLDDVLAGRRSLREVARSPEWDSAVAPAAQQATEQWSALPPEQREALVQQGAEQLEAARLAEYRERERRRAAEPE